jgi:hypothetical protein
MWFYDKAEPFRGAGLTAPVFHISDILAGDISQSRVYAEPLYTVLLFALFYPCFLFVFFCFVLFASLVCDTHSTPVRRRWQRRGRGVVEGLLQGCTNFPRVQQTLKKSRRQKGETKQVPYRRPTNIRRHSVKCSRQVCAPVA